MLSRFQDEELMFQRWILIIIAKLLGWVKVEECVTDVDLTCDYKRCNSVLLEVSCKASKTWSLVELKHMSTSSDSSTSTAIVNDASSWTVLGIISQVAPLKVISQVAHS